jgi:hypothetical protein
VRNILYRILHRTCLVVEPIGRARIPSLRLRQFQLSHRHRHMASTENFVPVLEFNLDMPSSVYNARLSGGECR